MSQTGGSGWPLPPLPVDFAEHLAARDAEIGSRVIINVNKIIVYGMHPQMFLVNISGFIFSDFYFTDDTAEQNPKSVLCKLCLVPAWAAAGMDVELRTRPGFP